jgi:hypothetical protein
MNVYNSFISQPIVFPCVEQIALHPTAYRRTDTIKYNFPPTDKYISVISHYSFIPSYFPRKRGNCVV